MDVIKSDSTIGERLTAIVEMTGLTDQEFAKSVRIDRSQFGKILKDKLGITLKQVLEISSQYNVRSGWILEGEEPMFKNEKSGALRLPDLDLLTKLKEQVESLINLHKLASSAEVPNEENVNQGAAYSGFEQDKNQKADTR